MATLHVKDVPEAVYRELKRRARRSGRSLSAEVRQVLIAAVTPARSVDEVVMSVERIRRTYAPRPGSPAVDDLLAEDRAR